MALSSWDSGSFILIACLVLLVLPSPAAAFGAGNIPSIAQVEGLNFRHGGKETHEFSDNLSSNSDPDIEDMLKTVAFIKVGLFLRNPAASIQECGNFNC